MGDTAKGNQRAINVRKDGTNNESRINQSLQLALSSGPNRVYVSHPSAEDRNRSNFKSVMFFRIPGVLQTIFCTV
jgi:hypothetical protein